MGDVISIDAHRFWAYRFFWGGAVYDARLDKWLSVTFYPSMITLDVSNLDVGIDANGIEFYNEEDEEDD